jgi:hypothetical protein
MNTIAKKLLLFLLALGLLTTQVWADDDDDGFDEDDAKETVKELSKPKKAAVKKAKSKESDGGLKIGFYGSIATSGGSEFKVQLQDELQSMGQVMRVDMDPGFTPSMERVGVLFDLGNGFELGLGIGFNRFSMTIEMGGNEAEVSALIYELVPSVSYQLGKKEFISYDAGLDFHLASWSITTKIGDESETDEPDGMNIALFPYFQLRAEIVKDFQFWLKAGLMVEMPSKKEPEEGLTISNNFMSAKTAIGVSFYL